MTPYYWTRALWDDDYLPKNWRKICSDANKLIGMGETDEERERISNYLWEKYCQTGEV